MKKKLPPGCSANSGSPSESKGFGGLDRIDSTENYSGSMMKWIELNSVSKNGFAVPIQPIQLTKLPSCERRSLVYRLTGELEQTRVVEKKCETLKIKFVNVQQKGLRVCNVKKSSELTAKGRVWNRSITGKFQPANHCVRVDPKAKILDQCKSLLRKLMSHKLGYVFNTHVDVVKLTIPDYFDIIKSPMDLGTIKAKLSSRKDYSPLDFLADIRLTFTNAKTYNLPEDKVHVMADKLSQYFELRWKAIEKNLVVSGSPSLPEKSWVREETPINKPIIHPKKRKLSPSQYGVVVHEPKKQKMMYEEKHKLSSELHDLLVDLPDNIIEFLKAQSSNVGDVGEDEIEIDIDVLSDDTLLALRKLLDKHLNQNKLTNSGACEIELPNVSCLSNFLSQVDGGNDSVDEDVGIGGDETPFTSCPPIEIDKDVEERAEECIEAASVSGLDQLEQGSQLKQYSSDSEGHRAGESERTERQVSPDRQDRAAFLKSRFLDTILKAREKTLNQDDMRGSEELRPERQKLEMHKKGEKARLQVEDKAEEDARKLAGAEEAAEQAKKRRDLKRKAAREALLKVEKVAEINDNSRFLQDLEMLRFAQPDQQSPITMDETSPDPSHTGFGKFRFGGSNPLVQLGLYMKEDDEEEESESSNVQMAEDDVEEGEIE